MGVSCSCDLNGLVKQRSLVEFGIIIFSTLLTACFFLSKTILILDSLVFYFSCFVSQITYVEFVYHPWFLYISSPYYHVNSACLYTFANQLKECTVLQRIDWCFFIFILPSKVIGDCLRTPNLLFQISVPRHWAWFPFFCLDSKSHANC